MIAAGDRADGSCAARFSGATDKAEDRVDGRGTAGADVGDAAAVVGAVRLGGVANTAASPAESSTEVSAPPELRTTTSGATEVLSVLCVTDCVAVVSVGGVVDWVFVVEPVTVDDGGVDTDAVFVAVLVVLAVLGEPDEFVVSVVLVESGVAHTTPGVVAAAMPTPSATANAPTRPMYFA